MKHEYAHASLVAFERTFAVYPQLWFEHKLGLFLLTLAILLPAEYFSQSTGQLQSGGLPAVAMALYLIGIAADIASTQYTFSQKATFDKRGLLFPVAESGLFLPRVPSLNHQLVSLNALAALLIAPLTFLYPSLGIALFTSRVAAAVANLRQYKRLSLTLKVIQDTSIG